MWKRVCLQDTRIVVAASSVLVVILRSRMVDEDEVVVYNQFDSERVENSSEKGEPRRKESLKAATVKGEGADHNKGGPLSIRRGVGPNFSGLSNLSDSQLQVDSCATKISIKDDSPFQCRT